MRAIYNTAYSKGFSDGYKKCEKEKNETSYWEYNPDSMDWNIGAWECAKCHCRNDMIPSKILHGKGKPPITHEDINPLDWAGSKFCPNCGRKMVNKESKVAYEN